MQIDYHLLTRHYAQQTSDQEEIEIITWQTTSDANQRRYTQLKRIWAMSNNIESAQAGFDVAEVWKETAARANARSILQKARQQSLLSETKVIPLNSAKPAWQRYAIAASISTILLGGVYYQLIYNPILEARWNDVSTLTLEDGTIVKLSEGAVLKYPKHFEDNHRNVSLSGKAFFQIAKDKTKPFTIDAGPTNVDILGTSFDLAATETVSDIAVKEGLVAFSDKKTGISLKLKAGERAKFANGKLDQLPNAKDLDFTDKPLTEIASVLSRFFEKPIIFDPNCQGNAVECTMTANFIGMTLVEIKETLELLLMAEIKTTKDGGLLITSFRCDLQNK
jgi:transmembrane sensor